MIRVTSVEIIDDPCDVFDVEVEHDASFVVAGVVLHNSKICIAHDGRVYKANDPRLPVPPLHPNCRSTLVPLPNVPGVPRESSPRQSYEDWLKQQDEATQNHVLGRGIAEHWRRGKIALGDLLAVDGRVLSLEQLRRALFASDPRGYIAWLESLPAVAREAVLGPQLWRAYQQGTTSLADLVAAGQARGVIEPG